MAEYASEVYAAFTNSTTPAHGSPQTCASTPMESPTRSSTHIIGAHRDENPGQVNEDVDNYDPLCSNQTPSPQFWEEATRIAAEVEKSAAKISHMKEPSASTHARTEGQEIPETAAPRHPGHDIECPSFDLLPAGETWTQHLATNNQATPGAVANRSTTTGGPSKTTSGTANVETHPTADGNTSGTEPATGIPLDVASEAVTNVASEAPIVDAGNDSSPCFPDSNQPLTNEGGQYSPSVACTIGTQTQDKKNRKKRAFLDRNNDANHKKLKKLKNTDKSKEAYDTYILRRCIRKPVDNEERPPFVDFGEYHVTYEEFREALKSRGKIDKNVMELFIRHFNVVTNIATTSEPMCTKFAFSQSLTTKLGVREDKFDPQPCLKEFQQVHKDHQLKSKDMVNNFITLASFANTFPKTNFSQFVWNNPQELRQQTTLFDCGIFVMVFMKQWDGKIMKPFNQDIIDLRMVIAYMILKSDLNKVDPTWVLKKK
ncbi:uncharacterized protein [Lolium perenne]|uniref:uncharacterized protein isoform X2 n=1 Tax=Lolium perenne TaxID=4522 RepID=UPI0021F517D3|nr:uncharacterized protein LOC127332295 isoform X2 [Lolium perenne]